MSWVDFSNQRERNNTPVRELIHHIESGVPHTSLICNTDIGNLYLSPYFLKYGLVVTDDSLVRVESFDFRSLNLIRDGIQNLLQSVDKIPNDIDRITISHLASRSIQILQNAFVPMTSIFEELFQSHELQELLCLAPICDWGTIRHSNICSMRAQDAIFFFPTSNGEDYCVPNHLVKVLAAYMQALARINQVILQKAGRECADQRFPFTSIRGYSLAQFQSPSSVPEGQYPVLLSAAIYIAVRRFRQFMFCTPLDKGDFPTPFYSDSLSIKKFLTNNGSLFEHTILNNISSGGFKILHCSKTLNTPFLRVTLLSYAGARVNTIDRLLHYSVLTQRTDCHWITHFVWFDYINKIFLPLEWERALTNCK